MAQDWLTSSFSLVGKRVWVAGHRGMVGSSLARRLASENCEILTDDLDLRQQRETEDWVRENRPDIIVVAAAKVGGILANSTQEADFITDNLLIEANIIRAAHAAKTEKLLFLGSSCIYPKDAKQPIKEESLLSGPLEPTNEAYAIAKIAGLKMCEAYRRQYGCDFISVMPCNLYGPGDRFDARQSHVIPALMLKAHEAKASGDVFHVWGTGKPFREFLYVDDLADALVFTLKNYSSEKPLNIGSGQEVSIIELLTRIAMVVGYEGEVVFDEAKPDGVMRKIIDSSRIFARGWRPKTDLEDGLRKTYEWFLGSKDMRRAA